MKRILPFALVLILIIASFSACEKTSGLYYDYDMSKYVSLGKYVKTVDRKSEDYAKSKVKFHEQTFGSNLSYETYEGFIELGDTANINYKGLKDGVAFEGGTSSNYDLKIGAGRFIDGFEDGLIGAKIGDTVNLNLTFPEGYKNEELAGEDVVFVVTINFAIKLGDPTEEDAKNYGFESLDDYETQADKFALGLCLFNNISKSATIKDYPKEESEILIDSAMLDYESYWSSMGTDLATALEYQGSNVADFRKTVFEQEIKPYMASYIVAYYLLQTHDAELTKEEVEAKRTELDEKYEATLESMGYDAIEIQHTAALSKIVNIISSEAKAIN